MKFNLPYGKTGLMVDLSDDLEIDIVEPRWINPVEEGASAIANALQKPIGCKPLKELFKPSDKVAIIFSDITRATPYKIILPPLLAELKDIQKNNIRFFCSNGTHRLATKEELTSILGKYFVENYTIIQNDVRNSGSFEYVGTTTSGNRIALNKEILKNDLIILTGFIEPHFFAGFSGGGKALVPGMASIETIKYNHSIAHLSQKDVTWGITTGNPIWEEIMEATDFVSGLFLLNITLNKSKLITNVFAGDVRSAHKAGCQFAKDSAMAPVNKLYDIVITSNSGFPLDLNIYQTVKGMCAAGQIVKKGGTIIIASECWDGIPGNSDYETILKSVKNVSELKKFIQDNESSLNDTWQIYFQALIQQKADIYLYSHKLDDSLIRSALLNPVNDIKSLINKLVNKYGPQTSICVLPDGPLTIPYFSNR